MKTLQLLGAGSAWLLTAFVAFADETLPRLDAGDETYTNVTVTGVSATHLYFRFAGGMGNVKLKNLDAALQKHFGFDAAKAGELESAQRSANAQFRAALANRKPAPAPARPPSTESVPRPEINEDGDLVVPKLYARSFRGQRPPQIFVEHWLTPPPDVNGKFVLVVFWSTSCGPCKQSIPRLNDLYSRFKDRLVVIGLSSETQAAVANMTSPAMNYFVGVDTQARTLQSLGVEAIPHAILIDPKGIVRFEGVPDYLDESALQHVFDKYAE